MKTYLNIKTNLGFETIDELNLVDFKNYKEFRTEKKRLINAYRIASSFYGGCYWSQKSTKEWNA